MHHVGPEPTRKRRLRRRLFLLALVVGACFASLASAQWAFQRGITTRRLPPTSSLPTWSNVPAARQKEPDLHWDRPSDRAESGSQLWSDYAGAEVWREVPTNQPAAVVNHFRRLPSVDQEFGPQYFSPLSTFGGMPAIDRRFSSDPFHPSGFSLFFASDEQDQEKDADKEKQEESDSKDTDATQDKDANGQDRADPNKPLGEQPEDTSRSFLRSATVLLEPGHIQVDVGLEYVHFETRDLFSTPNEILLERARRRQWFFPFAVRYGWDKKTQLFVNIPVGASLLETTTAGGGDTTSVFGMGDVQAGYLKVLREQDDCGPDVIFGSSFTAPTGADAFHPGRVAYLGSGFWSIDANLSLIKSIDPAVIVAKIGYVHFFQDDHLGQQIRLGERVTYDFGAGFAINDLITFSTFLQGSVQFPTEVNGIPVPNSSFEPISIRMALTDYVSSKKIIEPYVRFGLTEDAPQAELGWVTTYSH